MSLGTVVWSLVVGFLLTKVAGLVVNLATFPRLARTRTTVDPARLSLLVPARDEARTLPRTMPSWLAQEAGEILILDDGSGDGTAEVARRLAAGDPRVRVLHGEPLPAGWVGKNWACHQLAREANGELLAFFDADVTLAPGALAAVVGEIERQGAEALSVFPRQETGTLGERTLVPLIDDVLLTLLPFPLLRLPIPAAAAGNGQFFAFRRDAYERLGGHAAVRGDIIEDVVLARRVRRLGMRLGLSLGGELMSTRMYRSYGETVRGFGKSLRASHGDSRLLMAVAAAWHLVVYLVPLLLAPFEPRWLLPLALALMIRVATNAATRRGAYWEALLVPLAPVLALPIYALACGRRRVWKGRSYAS